MRIDSDGSNNDTKFYMVTGSGKENQINFGDAADDDVGRIVYDHNGDHMKFIVGTSEKIKIKLVMDFSLVDLMERLMLLMTMNRDRGRL